MCSGTTEDSNGTVLNDGDSVQLIKDLKVKGTSTTLKRGTVVKNIRLTSKSEEIEFRQGKSTMVLTWILDKHPAAKGASSLSSYV